MTWISYIGGPSEFNPDPRKQATEALFSLMKSTPNHLIFNGIVVDRVKESLGLILDSSPSFEKHLNEKIIKAKKNVGILKHLSKFLPLKTLDQMYKALVSSHLDYCDIIYHIPSHTNQQPLGVTLHPMMEKVERIQYSTKQLLPFLVLGMVQVVPNYTKNKVGKRCLIVVCVIAFYRFKIFSIARLLYLKR